MGGSDDDKGSSNRPAFEPFPQPAIELSVCHFDYVFHGFIVLIGWLTGLLHRETFAAHGPLSQRDTIR